MNASALSFKIYLLWPPTGKCFQHSFQFACIPLPHPSSDHCIPSEDLERTLAPSLCWRAICCLPCTCLSDSCVLILNSMPSQGVPLTLFCSHKNLSECSRSNEHVVNNNIWSICSWCDLCFRRTSVAVEYGDFEYFRYVFSLKRLYFKSARSL